MGREVSAEKGDSPVVGHWSTNPGLILGCTGQGFQEGNSQDSTFIYYMHMLRFSLLMK